MPRHSPCALSSLTELVAKSARLRFRRQPSASAEICARSLAPRFPREPASLGFARSGRGIETYDRLSNGFVFRDLVLYRIMQAISRKIFLSKLLPFTFRCCPQLKLKPSVALLITFSSLFSFQGTASSGFEARPKYSNP